jgi:hypothetical protein
VTTPGDDEASTWVDIREDGTFEVVGLAPGLVKVALSRHDGGLDPAELEIEAPASGVALVLPAAKPIRGSVVGAGEATTKYRVWAWRAPDGEPVQQVSVAADGSFSLDAIPADGTWMVAANAKGEDRYALVGPVDPGSENVTLKLVVGGSIEGTVTAAPGLTLPRRCQVSVDHKHWKATATPDGEGRFALRGLPPGRYTVSALTWGEESLEAKSTDVEVGRRDLRLVLAKDEGAGNACGGGGNACGAAGRACGR